MFNYINITYNLRYLTLHPTLYCNSISHILTISHNLMQLPEAIARILIHIATSFLTTKFSQGKIRMYDSLVYFSCQGNSGKISHRELILKKNRM